MPGTPDPRPFLRRFKPSVLPVALLLLAAGWTAAVAPSAQGQEKPPLTVDDYGPWKRITSVALSPHGQWMSHVQARLEGEDTLFVKALDRDVVHVVPRGQNPAFSGDSRWVAYVVAPPSREGAAGGAGARTAQQRPSAAGATGAQGRSMVLRNLETGDSLTFADAASFTFPENTGLVLVRKRGPGSDAGYTGADLVVHDLAEGSSLNLGNVSDFSVNEPGTHLAYLVDAQGKAGNGLYVLELATNRITPLDTDQRRYSQMSWNEGGSALAVLKGDVPDGKTQRDNVLLVFRDLGRPGGALALDPATASGFPQGFVLSELGGVRWSKNHDRLFLGIKEQADKREELTGRGNVDVWHWADVNVQSVQQVRAARDRNRTWSAVVNLQGGGLSFVRLADESVETVSQAGDSRWGIGRDPRPYQYDVAWGGSKADFYRVDLDTGERSLMEEGVGRTVSTSLDGQWWLYLRNEEVVARNVESGEEVNLTRSSGVDFINRQVDYPYERPAWGAGGWTDDGTSVLLYDQFDVWQVPVDGSPAANLTAGAGEREQIRFRVIRLDGGAGGGPRGGPGGMGGAADEGINLDEPLLLTAYGEWTKKSGYWEVKKGEAPQPLLWVDKSVGRPVTAREADRMVFTQQTFVEFPDYWVSDTRFRSPRKVTDANPQQVDFAWSPGRVLIDYVDERGNKLQGTLALPAGYQEGKRYPMLVYFYERMSQQHHSYSMPTYDDRPHMSTYASNGYLVLQPDIVYTTGRPGSSALDDLTAAVNTVIELGYADPDRIGLQGHSWGGYQSSFVVTQTDLFAAVVTGAPPTNLISFYNTLYRSSGTVQQGITEVGQVRMGTTPVEDFELYVSQSPVHQAHKITTPFMILHGTADGAVDWMQGLEYYNMARRLGKEVIFLSYPDEAHHLNQRNNQIDFQIRMMQYFDHHLKDAQPAKWMTDGVPHLERDYANPREMADGTLWGKKVEEEPGAPEGRRGGGG
jgi:dipeptidyl aminopeptidase/acylaminoacyl peptidase